MRAAVMINPHVNKFRLYECISKVTFTKNLSVEMAAKLMEYKDKIVADKVIMEKRK